jgi:hypothetical protein
MDIEALVNRILGEKSNDIDKATKQQLMLYFVDCHKHVKCIDKNIIDKLAFILSNPKFKCWIDKTASDTSDRKFAWISIANPGTVYEIKYDALEVPLKKYDGWHIELDYNSMTTSLEWLAVKAYTDKKHYGSLLYQIRDWSYNIGSEQEQLKKLFFACLDLSIEKLYDENQFTKISLND